MFRKLKRINFGLKYCFSTQHQQNQQQFNFSFQDHSKGSNSQNTGSDGSNFQFKNGEDPLRNNQQSQQDGQFSEISLPPFASQQDDEQKDQNEKKGEENNIQYNYEDDLNTEKDFKSQKFDVAVIGGGSGGLAFALEANKLGLKTIVFDFVQPTQRGTRWGIGGTCVNVGCIPKKLFHTASLIRDSMIKSNDFGFGSGQKEFNLDFNQQKESRKIINFRWRQLVENIQNHISDLNLGFEAQLMNRNIPYVNALATLGDKNTIYFTKNKEQLSNALNNQDFSSIIKEKINADYVVISVGGRPQFLQDCENSQKHSISSDDIFSLKKAPGKTLVVGGGYVALECAGFLSNLGMDTTVMTRDKYLRGFDQDIVKMIIDDMKLSSRVRFVDTSLPYNIQKNEKSNNYNNEQCEQYDTILQAVGRQPNTSLLNLNKVGVQVHPQSKKVVGGFSDDQERTSIDNIFSIGDVLHDAPELTPPAIMAGRLLAHRIFGLKQNDNLKYYNNHKMDYTGYPTTVFTPLEYSCVGLSEEQAINKYGQDNVEVYHSRFTPLEEQLSISYDEQNNLIKRKGYCKVICDKSNNNKVLGLHYLGPNAGEVMQGYAVAFRMNLYKHQLDSTIGIHPTCSEELLNLKVTKSSGEDFDKDTC